MSIDLATHGRPRKQIFVAGTWNADRAAAFADAAFLVGRELATAGFDLATGPGTGLSEHVIKGYRSVASRGILRTYLPRAEYMEKVGETVAAEFDEVVQTELDYPMRNVYHIKQSDGLIVITGGEGTFEECLPALIDYRMPTIVLKDSGVAARALECISSKFFPEWLELVQFKQLHTEIVSSLTVALQRGSAMTIVSSDSNPKDTL